MDPLIFDAFCEELKTAGVELTLRGYHGDLPPDPPRSPEYPREKSFTKKVPRKGLLRIFGKKTVTDKKSYEAAKKQWLVDSQAHEEKHYRPWYRQVRSKEIAGPDYMGTKLTARVLGSSPTAVPLTTDYAYSDKPINTKLTKDQVRGILAEYSKLTKDDKDGAEWHQGFNARARALLANPDVKFLRLEWG